MGKSSSCLAEATGIKRGPWTPEEDRKLLGFIQLHGHGSWRSLPQKAGLRRCGKSCRLRWRNYLRPDIKRGNFSLHEDQTIIQLHALLGNRWSTIAAHLPKRTDNEIKNHWNTHLKKRLAKIGFDPVTHKPKTAILGSAYGDPKNLSNLSHIAQWESARLQAEARFVKESKLRQPEIGPSAQPLEGTAPVTDQFSTSQQCLDMLRAWETALLMSKSQKAAPTNHSNNNMIGQDHVSFDGADIISSGCELSSLVDGSRAARSITSGSLDFNQLLGQHCDNECSELSAAIHHHNLGFEMEEAWACLEQLM